MRVSLTISGCVVALILLSASVFADDGLIRQELESQWRQLGEGIVTAEVRYTSGTFQLSLDANSPQLGLELVADEVNELIESLDLLNHPENREKLTQKLYIQHDFQNSPWDDRCRIIKKGQSVRSENSHELHVLRDGSHVFRYKPNHRVEIHHRDRFNRIYGRVEDFYQLPQDVLGVCRQSTLTEHTVEGELELAFNDNGREFHAWVDRTTGIPLRVRQSLNGVPGVEFANSGILVLPGGIPFPRMSFQAFYRNGLMYRLTVLLVDDVKINQPVADEQFQMQVLPGDRVFDMRPAEPRNLPVDQAVEDVLELADYGTIQTGQQSGLRYIPAWSVFFFFNGLAFLILGVLLWRRSRDPLQVVDQ